MIWSKMKPDPTGIIKVLSELTARFAYLPAPGGGLTKEDQQYISDFLKLHPQKQIVLRDGTPDLSGIPSDSVSLFARGGQNISIPENPVKTEETVFIDQLCPRCQGDGYIRNNEHYTARNSEILCPHCKGAKRIKHEFKKEIAELAFSLHAASTYKLATAIEKLWNKKQ